MSTTTTNYGLIKPDTTDPILIGQLNDNSDAIDAALKENADAIENKPDAADIPSPSTAAPAMDGTAAAGTSTDYARADHIHPSDTSKQDALSAAQLAAANSGIDSEKVEQIETNKNNISYTISNGVKNLSPTNAGSATRRIAIPLALTAGTYKIYIGSISSTDTDDTVCQIVAMIGNTVVSNYLKVPRTTDGAYTFNVMSTSDNVYIYASDNYAHSDGDTVTISDFMICKKSLYDAAPTYQPYAMSNVELTAAIQALQAQLANQ